MRGVWAGCNGAPGLVVYWQIQYIIAVATATILNYGTSLLT